MDCVINMDDLILNKSACDEDVDIKEIMELLPPWKTYLLQANLIDKEDFPKLNLKFLLNAHTEDDIQKWLDELQSSNKTTYSIHCTPHAMGKYLTFKQRLVCHHNTRSENVYNPTIRSRKTTKNTNCPSKITIVLHAIKRRYQGRDKEKYALMREMPCEVTFVATHNHPVSNAGLLRFRKMSDDVKEKLLNLFQNGLSPGPALQLFKQDIKMNNDNYEEILADRKYCPTYTDCYHLYRQHFGKAKNVVQVIDNVGLQIEIKEEDCTDNVASDSAEINSSDTVVLNSTEISSLNNVALDSAEISNTDKLALDSVETAKSILANINLVVLDCIDTAPLEMAIALHSMYSTLKKMNDASTLAPYLMKFGSDIQRNYRKNNAGGQRTVIIRRKNNRKNSAVLHMSKKINE